MIDTTLQTDERAVSPAIGVVLMVMMTVIMAAIIGTFLLGIAGSIDDPAPTVYLSYDYADGNVTITHETGSAMHAAYVHIRVSDAGQVAWHEGDPSVDPGESVTVGATFRTDETDLAGEVERGDTLEVVWNTGRSSTTLRAWEVG